MGWLPIILFILVGTGVLRALGEPRKSLHPLGFVALAFWVGALSSVFTATLIAVVTGRFYFEIVWLLAALAMAACVWRPSFWKQYLLEWRPLPDRRMLRSPQCWFEALGTAAVLIFIAKNLSYGVDVATNYPLTALDATGNFALKARLWFDSRELFPAPLMNPEYLMYKRTYPPVISGGEAMWAAILGEWDDRQIKWFFSACWMAAGGLIFAALRERGARLAAWLAMAFWFAFPVNIAYHWGGAIDGYADTPLAMSFAAAALAMGWAARRPTRWRDIIVLAILLGGAFWIKKEGIVLFAAVLGWLAWRRTAPRYLAGMAAIGALFYIVHWRTTIGVPNFLEKDVSLSLPLAELMARLRQFIPMFFNELGKDNKWGSNIWPVFAALWGLKLLYAPRRRWLGRDALFFAVLGAAYSVILLFTMFDFERNFDYAFERLFIQILPFLILATFDHCPLTLAIPWIRPDEQQDVSTPPTSQPLRRGAPLDAGEPTRPQRHIVRIRANHRLLPR